MRVAGISWAGVLTENFEVALDFFSEILGLSLDYRDEAKALAHFQLSAGQLLEVYGPSNKQRKEKYRWFNGPVLGFEVADVEESQRELIARGVRFITEVETWEGDAWAMFLGPEDKLFEIQRPARRYPEKRSNISGFAGAGVMMQNFSEAVQFFSQVMDISFRRRDDNGELAQFWLPAGQLFEVFGPNNLWSRLTPYATIAFEVEDIWQTHHELAARGVEFVKEVEITALGEAFTHLRGPDGYLYKLWQPVKP